MTNSKNKLSIAMVFALCLVLAITACESKTEKTVEPAAVKDTPVVKPIDTTAVPRPRQPGD